nr:hypothetical protein [Tanacetum cinerariifolium]
EHMAWQTDYCILKGGMSILRGQKSVPGMNSSEREMKRGKLSILSGRKSIPGMCSRKRENGKKDYSKAVRACILFACKSGVPVTEDEMKGWSVNMVQLYKKKWKTRPYADKSPYEIRMIKLMESRSYKISQANRSLHINAKAVALKLVKDSDEGALEIGSAPGISSMLNSTSRTGGIPGSSSGNTSGNYETIGWS